MLKNKAIVSALIAVSAIVMPISASESYADQKVPKHNTSCQVKSKVIKYKDTTFKCVSYNKKLVWKTVARSNASKPVSTLSGQAVVVARPSTSHEIFVAWANLNKSFKRNHFIYRDTGLRNDWVNTLNISETEAANIFANFVSKDTYSYAGLGNEFFQSLTRSNPLTDGGRCFQNINVLSACSNLNDAIFYRFSVTGYGVGQSFLALGAHEYFHLVQGSLGNFNARQQRTIPAWYLEGSAEFVGYSVMSMLDNVSYETITSRLPKSSNLDTDPYNAGRIAIETLVKKYGFNSVLKVFKDYANNRNFDTIFIENFGISQDDFKKTL